MVAVNNAIVNKGKYNGKTDTIIKVTKKKIALHLGKANKLT